MNTHTIRPASEWSSGEPGLFSGVPFSEYLSDPAVSNSTLSGLAGRTPAHARFDTVADTPSMSLGRMVHTAILEPMLFDQQYDLARKCTSAYKNGDACTAPGRSRHIGHWFCGRHTPKDVEPDPVEVVTEDQMSLIETIRANVLAAPAASMLFTLDGQSELSIRWLDPVWGIMCRGRIDRLAVNAVGTYTVLDIKTTSDGSAIGWSKSVARYGYHRQQAFYERGLRVLGVDVDDFRFVLAETFGPALVVVRALPRTDIRIAVDELNELVEVYRDCAAVDIWPGYDTTIVQVGGLPGWYTPLSVIS